MMPKNWSDFLTNTEPKTELFAFLSLVPVCLLYESAKKRIEVKPSALLLSYAWLTLPHVHKWRPTHDYFYTREVLCKRGIRR